MLAAGSYGVQGCGYSIVDHSFPLKDVIAPTDTRLMIVVKARIIHSTTHPPQPWTQQESGASFALTPGSVNGPGSIPKRETECHYMRHSR